MTCAISPPRGRAGRKSESLHTSATRSSAFRGVRRRGSGVGESVPKGRCVRSLGFRSQDARALLERHRPVRTMWGYSVLSGRDGQGGSRRVLALKRQATNTVPLQGTLSWSRQTHDRGAACGKRLFAGKALAEDRRVLCKRAVGARDAVPSQRMAGVMPDENPIGAEFVG